MKFDDFLRFSFCRRRMSIGILALALFGGDLGAAESPHVRVKFLFAFGEAGEKPGQLNRPTGISVDPQGCVYVADTGNNRLQKFDANGQLLATIGGFGWNSGQFQRPMDVASSNGLDVFVADYENNRIERYDRDLNWILTIRSDAADRENLSFSFPRSLAVSLQGDLFILDDEHRRIVKLNSQYKPILSFADYDWGDGELLAPDQCALSREDNLYVCDQLNHAIMVYDYFGNYLYRIEQPDLDAPSGIALWRDQVIGVSDRTSDQLFFFTVHGRFLGQFGSTGAQFGAFRQIGDLATYRNRLYVSDTDNHRIQVFELEYDEK